MEGCSLVQAFLSALEAGTTSQCPGLPPVSSLDMKLLVSWYSSRCSSGTGVNWHSPQHGVVDLCIYS